MLKILISFFILLINFDIFANENRLIIASTTSTNDTGLLSYINKEFEKKHKIKTHVLSLGTGQAMKIAKNGDVDLLLVHHPASEIDFIEKGFGIKRYKLMYNSYMVVGPKNDKNNCNSISNIFLKIKNDKLPFLSRGDESGTHKKEKELWSELNHNTNEFESWYKKIGQGMGYTLMMANEKKAYTLTDFSTWVSFNNKENLKIICKNKPPLFNQYSIIELNQNINSKINSINAKKYINWITSSEGKILINSYKINGYQLFSFNYK